MAKKVAPKKAAKKAAPKKRGKYEEKFKLNGSFSELIGAVMKDANSKSAKPKK
jgi:hypothetical protein